jgi:hypothetical protein
MTRKALSNLLLIVGMLFIVAGAFVAAYGAVHETTPPMVYGMIIAAIGGIIELARPKNPTRNIDERAR